MVLFSLQPGCQSCNNLRLLCCASIANNKSASNNSLGEFFFSKLFLPFLFLAQSERVSFGVDCASSDVQISRSRWHDLCLVSWSSCNWGTSLATTCACRAARRSQTTSRPATTVSGYSFSRKYFFLFSFSHRANVFRLVRIARRTTCRSAEAGGKTCAL